MAYRLSNTSETQKKRSLVQRVTIVHGVLLLVLLTIVSRLIELQVVKGREYRDAAEERHLSKIVVPAKRGEILGVNSKTGEENIFATNTTLDLLYVDPLITTDPAWLADKLADILFTKDFHERCSQGLDSCPRELVSIYASAFDPVTRHMLLESGSLLEPVSVSDVIPAQLLKLPDFVEGKRLFAESIKNRISEKRVTFAPLLYGATKVQMADAAALHIPGVTVSESQSLVYADPELVPQSSIGSYAVALGRALKRDSAVIRDLLRSRPLRYVPIMRKLPPHLTLLVKEAELASLKEAMEKLPTVSRRLSPEDLDYPMRSVALLPEHWRYYPDTTIASHVVGFMNQNAEPQYGVERTFNPQLHGQEGLINTVRDLKGGQILTGDQTVVDAKDGDTLTLTLDRAIQKEVETLLAAGVEKYQAESGQAIVMDPSTGRILAMANAPLFDGNSYAHVYDKEVMPMTPDDEKKLVVEIANPDTNVRVVRGYVDDVFSASGRLALTDKTQKALVDLEKLYDLRKIARYYHYIGDTLRREVFPTDTPGVWLKYKNDIGVGAYLNRTIQEIYEPGSVMKPITMAIALDQGEVVPSDTYDDREPILIDEQLKKYVNNNDFKFYGKVNMVDCIAYSINTCMTSIGRKMGAKLFYSQLQRFGFGRITSVELDDELPGELHTWRDWRLADIAAISFGQGLSATPLQVISAWAALANGGTLMRPTIVDSVTRADGTVIKTEPRVVEQVIKPETSETLTALLTAATRYGFAKAGKVPGYRLAGKTGTSQIAGPGGTYETGTGSTFATYAGYAPVDRPRFVILVKMDRPKQLIHGATTAAPVFKDIAAFLFKYYDLPPDEGVPVKDQVVQPFTIPNNPGRR